MTAAELLELGGRVTPNDLFSTPSPVSCLWTNSAGGGLWLKDDGAIATPYGGNKVRKLARILPHARALGRRRLFTFGAAGSHHALATAVYAKRFGLRTAAILTPQRWSTHAETTLRAALAQGLEVYPVGSALEAIECLPQLLQHNDLLVGPGAMGPLGSMGFVDAVHELMAQVRAGLLPMPASIVVAAGTGSTAAGILAGLVRNNSNTRLLAVAAAPRIGLRTTILTQAALTLWKAQREKVSLRQLSSILEVVSDENRAGYGQPTKMKAAALGIADELGLELDVTYTAAAFHRALMEVGHPRAGAVSRPEPVLYWHTLSTAKMTPLLAGAPPTLDDPRLASLLVRYDSDTITEARW